MNKKAAGTLNIKMVMAIFLAIVLLIFLLGGGLGLTWDITKLLKSIPTFIWVILGFIILFKLLPKGK